MGKRILVEETLAKDGICCTIKKTDLGLLQDILNNVIGARNVVREPFPRKALEFAYDFYAAINPHLKAK